MQQKFTFLAIFFLFVLPVKAQLFPQLGSQRAGISALTFLKMDVSPRSAGLAGANICLTGDGYSTYTNPATLAEVETFSLAGANTFWIADINFAYLTASTHSKRVGTFGFSLSALNSGAMEVRTTFQPEGTGELFYANYFTAGLSYSKRLTDQFSWGITGKYVQERLAQFVAQTGVVDLGFLYETDFKDLRFAVMVQSFGVNSKLRGSVTLDTTFNKKPLSLDSYPTPTVFQLGISIVPWKSADEKQSLTTMLQLNHPNDNAENIRIGLEYNYKDLLFLRAGYKINVSDQNLPTAGVGIRTRAGRHPLMFDYALDPMRYLGIVHRVGLNFSLNPTTENNE
ncbi:MAG: PorV/PorQ family protein [Bacteroidia bacterium]|nr:PorV/PorQ family protein [Bacteroidia bacterium]